MSKAPLPQSVQGDFFVLECCREDGSFTIHLDDGEQTSYDLGDDIAVVMRCFRLWKLKDIGYRAIDLARDFGAVQAIPADGRVIALFDRNAHSPDVFQREKEKQYVALPDL